jgi:hypothetical protein
VAKGYKLPLIVVKLAVFSRKKKHFYTTESNSSAELTKVTDSINRLSREEKECLDPVI